MQEAPETGHQRAKIAARLTPRAASRAGGLAFALGIGVTTAVFSLFYGVLLKPLPYPNPDALVMVYDTQPSCSTCPASFPKYIDWRTRNTVFSAIGGSTTGIQVITGVGEPELRRPTRPSSPGPELLIGVALLAVAVPAFQASRTDPMVVLRNDRGRGRFAALPSVCVDFGVCLGRE